MSRHTPRTNRDIRRAFGPEAMQVIAEQSRRLDRLEAILAGLLQREEAAKQRVSHPSEEAVHV